MRAASHVLLHQDRPERRQHRRKKSFWPAKLETPLGCLECLVLDFTSHDAKVRLLRTLAPAQPVSLVVDPLGRFPGVVVWQRDGCTSIRFTSYRSIGDIQPGTTGETSEAHAMTRVLEPALPTEPAGGSVLPWDRQTISVARIPDILTRSPPPRPAESDAALTAIEHLRHDQISLTLDPGEILFKEGDPGACMYVVKSGTLRIKSGQIVYEDVERGGIVGEMGLVDQRQPRSATVYALTGSEVVEIDEQGFLSLVDQLPEFSVEVMRILSRRLRHMNQLYRPERAAEPHR